MKHLMACKESEKIISMGIGEAERDLDGIQNNYTGTHRSYQGVSTLSPWRTITSFKGGN